MTQQQCEALVRWVKAPVPVTGENVFVVEGIPKEWPSVCAACYMIAVYTVRMALEQNCAYVEVRRHSGHTHRFDAVDILNAVRLSPYGLQAPTFEVPSNYKTAELTMLGGEPGHFRRSVAVPDAVSASPAA